MGRAAMRGRVPDGITDNSSPHSLLGIAIVTGVFAVNIYRATHQSITADEAFTWDFYVDKPFNWILIVYSTNNHILHTLLCRLSVKALGLSELTMRLPSLAGGLLYLAFVYKLCRLLFNHLWTFLLAMLALTLNPFITDYLSAARGYGMALGFFTAALYFVMRFFHDEPTSTNDNRVTAAAILLGLSISANIIFVFSAVALAGILALLRLVDAKHTGGWIQKMLWIAGRVWLPFLCAAGLFLAIPLANARQSDFYRYGKDSLRETTLSLVQRSLFHQYNVWTDQKIPDTVTRSVGIVAAWIIPLMLALGFAVLIPVCWRWMRERDLHRLGNPDRAYLLIGAVFATSLGMLVAAHYLVGMLYPIDRTAIYLVGLLTLEWMLLIQKALAAPHWNRAIGMLAAAPVAIAILLFLGGFTTSYYYEWRYDAGTKRIFHLLEGRNQFSSSRKMKLGVDWKLDLSLNFYRQMYQADWLARVLRDPPPEAGGFDYYVLLPEDEEATRKLGLRVIYRDPISNQELAVPAPAPALLSKKFF